MTLHARSFFRTRNRPDSARDHHNECTQALGDLKPPRGAVVLHVETNSVTWAGRRKDFHGRIVDQGCEMEVPIPALRFAERKAASLGVVCWIQGLEPFSAGSAAQAKRNAEIRAGLRKPYDHSRRAKRVAVDDCDD